MKNTEKTREQLVEELGQRNAELETMRIRQQVLSQVREEIWKMKSSEEIALFLEAVRDGLQKLGMPFKSCGVNLIDNSVTPPIVSTHNMIQGNYCSASDGIGISPCIP